MHHVNKNSWYLCSSRFLIRTRLGGDFLLYYNQRLVRQWFCKHDKILRESDSTLLPPTPISRPHKCIGPWVEVNGIWEQATDLGASDYVSWPPCLPL